jgi:hypothetical protein
MQSSYLSLMIRHVQKVILVACLITAPLFCCRSFAQAHLVELLADRDSRYKINGQGQPEIVVRAGEPVLMRIEARKGKTWNRDGSIHGFTLLRRKDRTKVTGWDFLLRPGVQEFWVTAPAEPGEYTAVCTVICSQDHEGMHIKFIVLP